MAFYSNGSLPSKPDSVKSRPRYSAQSFDTSYSGASYTNYSDSLADPLTGISEYDYDSSKLNSNKNLTTQESFGSRVFSAFSDAVKNPNTSGLSRNPSIHTRARSIADSAGPMLARTTSIRLGGLLNRTPTQKQTKPAQEDDDLEEPEEIMEYKTTFTSTPERASRTMTPKTQTPSRPAPQKGGRFSWFSQQKSDMSHPSTPTAALELEDPLLNLNVNASLFPTGNADPLNPESFNDLLLNACALVDRLQVGYREKTSLLKQANAERDAAVEENDEASTRAAHLKSQLETMAARAAEQDRAMQALADQLAAERQARQEKTLELESLRKYRQAAVDDTRHDSILDPSKSPSAGSDAADDDSTPRRRRDNMSSPRTAQSGKRDRKSDGLNSDSGFESDADSISYSLDTASTISGPVTPATGYAMSLNATLSPTAEHAWGESRRMETPVATKPNTAGVWGVVGDLQRENFRLKTRVKELEGAVEGCLSLVAS